MDRTNTIGNGTLTWEITYPAAGELSSFKLSDSLENAASLQPGDITGEGTVNLADLLVLAEQWLLPAGVPSADIAPLPDGDGNVDLQDFALLAEYWLN